MRPGGLRGPVAGVKTRTARARQWRRYIRKNAALRGADLASSGGLARHLRRDHRRAHALVLAAQWGRGRAAWRVAA